MIRSLMESGDCAVSRSVFPIKKWLINRKYRRALRKNRAESNGCLLCEISVCGFLVFPRGQNYGNIFPSLVPFEDGLIVLAFNSSNLREFVGSDFWFGFGLLKSIVHIILEYYRDCGHQLSASEVSWESAWSFVDHWVHHETSHVGESSQEPSHILCRYWFTERLSSVWVSPLPGLCRSSWHALSTNLPCCSMRWCPFPSCPAYPGPLSWRHDQLSQKNSHSVSHLHLWQHVVVSVWHFQEVAIGCGP